MWCDICKKSSIAVVAVVQYSCVLWSIAFFSEHFFEVKNCGISFDSCVCACLEIHYDTPCTPYPHIYTLTIWWHWMLRLVVAQFMLINDMYSHHIWYRVFTLKDALLVAETDECQSLGFRFSRPVDLFRQTRVSF